MRAAIIGCGKQADAHAAQIKKIQGCDLVCVCDSELLLAKQLAERFVVEKCFEKTSDLLRVARPNVVHIITPPRSHFPIAKECLEAGCHVLVEKPFTVDYQEAETLITLALSKNLKLTVGHHHQFSDVSLRMRELVGKGFLGNQVVHMESTFGYDFTDERYAKALLGDKTHWVRRLPGNLLHNIISHPVSKVAEYLTDCKPKVIAYGFSSRFLRNMEEGDITDELRAIISDSDSGATAYLTFSSQISPIHHQLRVFGSGNSLVADFTNETLIEMRKRQFKSYLNHILPPIVYGRQYLRQAVGNVRRFVTKVLNFESGRKRLIESFYASIRENRAEPIPYSEILRTAWIMDEIFRQLKQGGSEADIRRLPDARVIGEIASVRK